MRLALSQMNAVVGDLPGNEAKIVEQVAAAQAAGAQVVVFPELAVTGYPPEDLLFKEHFLRDARAVVDRVAATCDGIVAVVGFPDYDDDAYNAAAVCADGAVQAVYRKVQLPNYGVFDELRYFQVGEGPALVEIDGVKVGLTICEDIWVPGAPLSEEANAGARLVLNLSASPYSAGKPQRREQMLAQRARDSLVSIAFCGLVGGQDELVFDGSSCVLDHHGEPVARAPLFTEALLVCDVDTDAPAQGRLRDTRPRAAVRQERPAVPVLARLTTRASAAQDIERHRGDVAPWLDPVAEVYAALVLGTRDYVEKNGFAQVVLGLSGGIDSALVVLVAVDALGADRVNAVIMPSRYSSTGTQSDAKVLADNLGIGVRELPIEGPMRAYDELLAESFEGLEADLTEENLQARIRGNLLMALSNKLGWLVLTTGNKSEMSVGYSTLYGDSAGGFAVIKDVPKTLVYELVAARAHRDPVDPVPEEVVSRPPSAELRPDQADQDSLPPYDVLDPILQGYVEDDLGRDALVGRGWDGEEVSRIIRLVDVAEYKRRQNPPGIKITPRSFGRDRRLPITNRYGG